LIREFFLPTRQACEAGGNGKGVRKKRGEHMSYSLKFENIGAWHLAREVARKSNQQSSINNHQSNKVTLNGEP